MFDPLLTSAILGGIQQASQNAIRNQNNRARQYGNGSARLDNIQSQQIIQQRIQKMQSNQSTESTSLSNLQNIHDMIARFAVCCYVARADGTLSASERQRLDSMYGEISTKCKLDTIKREMDKIYFSEQLDMITIESYLKLASADSIVASLALAEDIVNSDKKASAEENQNIYTIRKYLTDRTGKNYISNTFQINKETDSRCSGCGATMDFVPYAHRFECPYCGNTKYV